jgi:hypothetical protein
MLVEDEELIRFCAPGGVEARPREAGAVLSGEVSQPPSRATLPCPGERVLIMPVELAELERRIEAFVRGIRGG